MNSDEQKTIKIQNVSVASTDGIQNASTHERWRTKASTRSLRVVFDACPSIRVDIQLESATTAAAATHHHFGRRNIATKNIINRHDVDMTTQ